MKTLNQNARRPLCARRDVSKIPLSMAVKAVAPILQSMKQECKRPEVEAARFYLLSHAMSEVRLKVDGDAQLGKFQPVVDMYYSVLNEQAARLYTYMFLITTREARHAAFIKDSSAIGKRKRAWGEALFGSEVLGFQKEIQGEGHNSAIYTLLGSPPEIEFGKYLDYLTWVFYETEWSASFGGAKWGTITGILNRLVHGEFSLEVLMDTGYTLAHNGGPIFNKGLVFHDANNDSLMAVLDHQAAGQIPALIRRGSRPKLDELKPVVQQLQNIIGTLPMYVDSAAVQKAQEVREGKEFSLEAPTWPIPEEQFLGYTAPAEIEEAEVDPTDLPDGKKPLKVTSVGFGKPLIATERETENE